MDLAAIVAMLVANGQRLTTGEAQTDVQARAVHAVQLACDLTDGHRSWHYKYRTAEVSVTANTQPLFPDEYLNFGEAGGVFVQIPGTNPPKARPLRPLSPQLYYQRRAAGRSGPPATYTPGEGVDLSNDRYLFLEPLTNQDITLDVVFERAFPRLTLGGNNNALLEIPSRWHDSVIYEMALRFLMKENANIQSRTEQKEIAKEFLDSMTRQERWGREAVHHLNAYAAAYMNR